MAHKPIKDEAYLYYGWCIYNCQDSTYPMYSASMFIVLNCLLFTPLGPDQTCACACVFHSVEHRSLSTIDLHFTLLYTLLNWPTNRGASLVVVPDSIIIRAMSVMVENQIAPRTVARGAVCERFARARGVTACGPGCGGGDVANSRRGREDVRQVGMGHANSPRCCDRGQ